MVPNHFTLTGLAAAAACALYGAVGCTTTLYDPSSSAVLNIEVTRQTGAPVVGAFFDVLVQDSARGDTVIGEPMGVTDGAGRFQRVIGSFLRGPFRGDVTLIVRPDAASGLADSTVEAGVVQFRLVGEPMDTLHVSIVYP